MIGPEIDLTDLRLFADGPPHDVYRQLRDDAPLHWNAATEHTPGGEGFWSLTRHADVDWAAKHPELLSWDSGANATGAAR